MDGDAGKRDGGRKRFSDFSVEDLRAVAMIADAGSMTAAARKFAVSKSVLSRAVGKLEAAADGPLFERSGQGMALTAIGAALMPVAARATALVREADEAIRAAHGTPQGTLHVASGAAAAERVVGPAMAALTARHPEVRGRIDVIDAWFDPSERDIDVLVRIGRAEPPHLSSHLIMSTPMALYVGPDAGAVALDDPAAVEGMGRVVIEAPDLPREWRLTHEKRHGVEMDAPAAVRVNDPAVAVAVLVERAAVALLPMTLGEALVAEGRLRRALPGWRADAVEMYAVLPPRRASMPSVAAFLRAMRERAAALEAFAALP